MDEAWWNVHMDEVKRTFEGQRFSTNWIDGVQKVVLNPQRNSGLAAIKLAMQFGAEKIVLLGYDCQHTGGKKHWHGDHPKQLGNAGSVQHWPMRFVGFARKVSGVEIVNASRETALECFTRMDLEDALAWI
jgi:hypothetical protein